MTSWRSHLYRDYRLNITGIFLFHLDTNSSGGTIMWWGTWSSSWWSTFVGPLGMSYPESIWLKICGNTTVSSFSSLLLFMWRAKHASDPLTILKCLPTGMKHVPPLLSTSRVLSAFPQSVHFEDPQMLGMCSNALISVSYTLTTTPAPQPWLRSGIWQGFRMPAGLPLPWGRILHQQLPICCLSLKWKKFLLLFLFFWILNFIFLAWHHSMWIQWVPETQWMCSSPPPHAVFFAAN